jgi:hypothetical protein
MVWRSRVGDWIDELTELLFGSSFLSLATTDGEGRPWVTPVEFACDDALRFYWTSHLDARHSRNLRVNPRAALSIYDSTQAPGVLAPVQGLYAEGTVQELGRADFEALLPSLGRWLEWRDAARGIARHASATDSSGDDTSWCTYRLTTEKVYALDPGGHPDLPGVRISRVPVDLTESFSRAYRARLG